MAPFADLNTTWFALIGLLWAGYFFLEGFDFGVSIVAPFVAADETERRMCLNTIGPVWDGNEVWLLTAGGGTFAAFPLWYGPLFPPPPPGVPPPLQRVLPSPLPHLAGVDRARRLVRVPGQG